MRTLVLALVALVLPLLSVAAPAAADQVVVGQTQTIRSSVLNEDRTYRVYLPASYRWAQDRRYPVLYLLDGQAQFLHTASSVDYLAAQGEIPEMIVVAVDSTVRVRDFTQTDWSSHWVGGGGAANFKKFLSAELIPAVDRAYRTDGFRALSGHSAAGQFVLYCLTAEPSLFKGYIALSPSLDWDDNLPQRSLEESFKATRSLKAFLYVARSDDSGRALADYDRLVETLKTTSPQEFRWHSQPYPGETHMSVPLLSQIDALRRLYAGYRLHNDMLEKGLAFAEQHFRDVSKAVGWPIPVPEEVINNLGYQALSGGKTGDAIALFTRNVEANPSSAGAFDSLAEAYAKAEMWKEAVLAEDRAVELAARYDHPGRSYFVEQAKKYRARLAQGAAGSK